MAMYYVGDSACDPNYLEHHGVKGMKWGVRRYQNPDGTWTEAGKKRYGNGDSGLNAKQTQKTFAKKLSYTREFGRLSGPKNQREFNDNLQDIRDSQQVKKMAKAIYDKYDQMESLRDEKDWDDPEFVKARKEYYDECKKWTEELLGKYGSKRVKDSYSRTGKETVADALTQFAETLVDNERHKKQFEKR